MVTYYRPCWADIDLGALRHNLKQIQKQLKSTTGLLAVVKANGYGHGMDAIARVAVKPGALFLGVSSLEEGEALRNAGFKTPILVLGTLFPFENFSILFDRQLTPTLASLAAADALNRLAERRRRRLPVHLKIDTGFGRIGVSAPNALRFIEYVAGSPGLDLQGIYTHFSSSDVDPAYTKMQIRTFWSVVQAAEARGIRPRYLHLANSAAILRFPESHGTLVRPGLALYGARPYKTVDAKVRLRPVLSWKTRVIFLKTVPKGFPVGYARTWKAHRPTRIATLAVGYADGYPRILSNTGFVLIRGRKARILGRVTMDMMMVDVTGNSACQVGDEAILLGQQGRERIMAEEVAELAQTNAYEILSRIATRVPRIYHGTN
jgi:alanine racemase